MHPRKKNRNFFPPLLLLLLVGLFACTSKIDINDQAPADLIARDTMVAIFVDLRLLDAVVNFEQRKGNRKVNDINFYLHNSIMEKYHISREQFERSFTHYQNDLEEIDGIYADALTQLSKMKTKIEQE